MSSLPKKCELYPLIPSFIIFILIPNKVFEPVKRDNPSSVSLYNSEPKNETSIPTSANVKEERRPAFTSLHSDIE